MAIVNKQTSVNGTAQQISVDGLKNQRLYITLSNAGTAYFGASNIASSGTNSGFTLYNAASPTTLDKAVIDVPSGEKLYVIGSGTINVTAIPLAKV